MATLFRTEIGTVNSYDYATGKGSVTPDTGGSALQLSVFEVTRSGIKDLEAGQKISYQLPNGKNLPINISRVKD